MGHVDAETLVFLHQIARSTTLTAAAERLGLTRSALSHRLRDIESRLGVTLFHRSTRRLEVSEAGRVLLSYAERISAELADANDALSHCLGDIAGPVRLTAPPDFGQAWLAPHLNDFLIAHPGVTCDVVLTDRRVELIDERFDLALRVGRSLPMDMIAHPLVAVTWHLYASPRYLAAHGTPAVPSDLAPHRYLGFAQANPVHCLRLRQGETTVEVALERCLQANHTGFLLASVLAGNGFAVLPDYAAAPYAHRGEMVLLLNDWLIEYEFGNTAYLVYPRHRLMPRRVDALVEYLRMRGLRGAKN